jgi:predicted nucleic-acid-binding protein
MAVKSGEEEAKRRLKASFLEVVDNQLKSNDPPETRLTLDRLIAQGFTKEDAKIYISQVVCHEAFLVMKHNKPYDQARYIGNLQRLPKEPQE